MSQPKRGFFTDYLSTAEVNFSKVIANELKKASWAQKLLNDTKISDALNIQPNQQIKYSQFNQIKSALFEVRFAYALYTKQLAADYEKKTGVGNSTVDFKVQNNGNSWLIELTSLRESDAVKHSTSINKANITQYISIDTGTNNSAEVLDLIKLQNAIYRKVIEKIGNKMQPIKFPNVAKHTYHTIVVDARSFNAGIYDYYDFFIVVNGSLRLRNIHEGFCCRYFIDKEGRTSHILGIFEESNDDEMSKIVREKIHFICFIIEKEYKPNEISEKMIIFANPKYFHDPKAVEKIWLFKQG